MNGPESPADKKARLATEAEKAWADYHAERAATDKNMERLRAARLAREAQEATAPEPKAKAAKKTAAKKKKK